MLYKNSNKLCDTSVPNEKPVEQIHSILTCQHVVFYSLMQLNDLFCNDFTSSRSIVAFGLNAATAYCVKPVQMFAGFESGD